MLTWGILSAAVLRLFMIALGAELIERSQVRQDETLSCSLSQFLTLE